MSPNLIARLLKSDQGAVAPTVGISLFALVAAGGIAFDYARMATLDTELQNAADQAALAAATQLDGNDGARARAISAAQTLVTNQTLMANDVGTRAISVPTVTFYKEKEKIPANLAATDAEANFVLVTVGTREAFFALTPIVAAISSGPIAASAYAGLSSAICKVPPVMICNPDEPNSNTNIDLDFDAASRVGYGMKLITGNADAPGNFGFLDAGVDQGSSTGELSRSLGYNTPPGNCQPTDGVDLKTGMRDVVLNALNTRFDIYASGAQTCNGGGTCSPSANARKDLVRGNSCDLSNSGWAISDNPYRPTSPQALPLGTTPDAMGFPRDICHAWRDDNHPDGSCGPNSRIGNGDWDRDAYFRANYNGLDRAGWKALTGLGDNAPRYEVYKWELNNPSYLSARSVGSKTAYGAPSCGIAGITPDQSNVDRRRISAAVLNCNAWELNGSESDVKVLKWIELFLVEPSLRRRVGNINYSEDHDVYVEIIGETNSGGVGATAGQVVRRDVPYLIE